MAVADATPFSAAFLDDYFAECDEHLTAVQRGLLTLEGQVGQPCADLALLDELLRRYHTLKGLSGMVGLEPAEQLAHQLESYLRSLRRQQTPPGAAGLEALVEGTRALERVIAARRTGSPLPSPLETLERLASLGSSDGVSSSAPAARRASPAPAMTSLDAGVAAAVAEALAGGCSVWRFTFRLAAALVARGVTVKVIRDRLQQVGQLLQAVPRVEPGTVVAFEFLVATTANASTFAAWSDDGLTWARYEPPPAPVEPPAVAAVTPANVVRVDLARLEELMRLAGDLVISRARLDDTLRRLQGSMPPEPWRLLQEVNQGMERQLRSLREGVMRVRLVPIGDVFTRMQFVVRDLARESSKQVRLVLQGQETQIDKYVVEQMMDPLLHLIRNAIGHGLEPAAERLLQGKPAEGTLTLRARTAGETVVLEVEDDGAGIDPERVAARARQLQMFSGPGPLDPTTLLNILCLPGFTMREQADRVSGRGVGMDVVKTAVQELGGSLAMTSTPGRGTRFTIKLPLTLAITDALIARVGGQTFAVPQTAVHEVFQLRPEKRSVLENNELVPYREGALPLLYLARLFGLPDQANGCQHVLVTGGEGSLAGLVVDRILGQREIVVRALADPLVQVPGIAGATELGDGQAVLILDAQTLVRHGRREAPPCSPGGTSSRPTPDKEPS